MTLENWLSKHPYLRPVAAFHAQVAEAVNSIPAAHARIPDWQEYSEEYKRGVPVLAISPELIDSEQVERSVGLLLEKLASMRLPEEIHQQSLALCAEFHGDPSASERMTAWLLGHDDFALSHPGLFRYLGWTMLASYLRPLIAAFENWRDEEAWLHPYCPICGSGPSMAQLAGTEPARRRMLVCGSCGTRWRFSRMGCPFCEKTDDQGLSVLSVQGEKQFRIDYCDACHGYLKTYAGEGNESVLLTDWTSLHLDLLAKDRGLKRLAESRYDF